MHCPSSTSDARSLSEAVSRFQETQTFPVYLCEQKRRSGKRPGTKPNQTCLHVSINIHRVAGKTQPPENTVIVPACSVALCLCLLPPLIIKAGLTGHCRILYLQHRREYSIAAEDKIVLLKAAPSTVPSYSSFSICPYIKNVSSLQ